MTRCAVMRVMMLALACCFSFAMAGCGRQRGDKATRETVLRGGELFSRYCEGCHPGGGNSIYPQKSLHRMNLAANGITTPADIVAIIRNPGQGMKQFDKHTIPDPDAFAIAQYILATY